jgi:hypothetical protein
MPLKLLEAHAKAEKIINGFNDSCVADLQQLKVKHIEYIDKHVSSYRKFEQLRQKLLNGGSLNPSEATGEAVANMLKAIAEGSSVENSYCL